MEDERLSELSANTCADLLRQRYRLLLISQTVWTIVTRVVFVAAVLAVAWMPRHGPRVSLVALGAILYGVVGWYAERAMERKRFRLEELFVEQLPQNDPLAKIYIEWRHEDWKRSLDPRVLQLEPFLWVALLIVVLLT
jgi:hypothetical protein